jgi:hypothetical protein
LAAAAARCAVERALSKKPAFGAGDDGTHALGNSAMIVSTVFIHNTPTRSVFTPAGL